MPLLEGSRPVQGLPHARVLAEEGLAVVLDPVQHLRAQIRKSVKWLVGKSGHKEAPYGKGRTAFRLKKWERSLNQTENAALPATLSFKGLNESTASAWTYDPVQ